MSDEERVDHFDAELARVHGDMFGRQVALLAKGTGIVIATYPSLAAAFQAMPELPDGAKASAFLGWVQ